MSILILVRRHTRSNTFVYWIHKTGNWNGPHSIVKTQSLYINVGMVGRSLKWPFDICLGGVSTHARVPYFVHGLTFAGVNIISSRLLAYTHFKNIERHTAYVIVAKQSLMIHISNLMITIRWSKNIYDGYFDRPVMCIDISNILERDTYCIINFVICHCTIKLSETISGILYKSGKSRYRQQQRL